MPNKIGASQSIANITPSNNQQINQDAGQVLGSIVGQLQNDQAGAQQLNGSLQGQVGFSAGQLGQTFGTQHMQETVEILADATNLDGSGGGGDVPVE